MAMFLLDRRGEQRLVDAAGVVGGVGQHVDAAVDGDAYTGKIGRVGEDQLAVEMAFFNGGLGNVERHGQNMAALHPGTGEELGQIGAGGEIATHRATGSLGRGRAQA